MTPTNQNSIFLKLRNIRPTKNISNIILSYHNNPKTECLLKQFNFLKKKEFVDSNGKITIVGMTTCLAGNLNLSFLATLMLVNFMIQRKTRPRHSSESCRVDTSEIRATLSPIVSKARLKMLTSELLKNNCITKQQQRIFFLNHSIIEKISSMMFFDEVIIYLNSDK